MKQVDADGLELITVNGGELKPTQGGGVGDGETPSIETIDGRSVLHVAGLAAASVPRSGVRNVNVTTTDAPTGSTALLLPAQNTIKISGESRESTFVQREHQLL